MGAGVAGASVAGFSGLGGGVLRMVTDTGVRTALMGWPFLCGVGLVCWGSSIIVSKIP